MNILMLLEAPFPSDIRVSKEYKSLIAAGHKIFLLCIHRNGLTYSEQFDGLQITRISVGESNYVLAFWDVVNAINFYHPLFGRAISKLMLRYKIDAVHVHDLPLAGTALKLRKKFKYKVVLDLHENYPEALKVWHSWKKNPIARVKNKLFLNYKKWNNYESEAVKKSDHVICVVDEMKERIIKDHNIPEIKISVVTNSEEKSFLNQPHNENIYEGLKDKFIVTYTGGVGPHRGVDTLIMAMSKLKQYEDIVVVIAGSGSKSVMDHLNHLIRKNSLEGRVLLLGYQPFHNFLSLMKFSTVNVIPHHSNGHTDNTIPHKLFQGMMAGKPLLVSTSTAIKRVVKETNSGLIFEAGNSDDFALKLEILYKDKRLREQLASNGIKATMHLGYNWESTSKKLVDLYNGLEAQR